MSPVGVLHAWPIRHIADFLVLYEFPWLIHRLDYKGM